MWELIQADLNIIGDFIAFWAWDIYFTVLKDHPIFAGFYALYQALMVFLWVRIFLTPRATKWWKKRKFNRLKIES